MAENYNFYLHLDPILDKQRTDYSHKDPFFYPTEFSNLSSSSKRRLKGEVLIDRNNPFIFTIPNSTGSGRVLQGLVDRTTGLFVRDTSQRGDATSLLHKEALTTFRADIKKEVESWSDQYRADMKSDARINMEVEQNIRRWSDITKSLNSQIAQLPTNTALDYNSHLVYQGETIQHDLNDLSKTLVTERMPFENPIHHQALDTSDVEVFLDTFFDLNNKEIFAWYLGAALANKDIDDETVSRALVLLSPGGGRGKTTLVDLMVNNLFPEDFVDRHGSFDTIFDQNNKFGTSVIKNRRLVIYNEATWGVPDKDGVHNHDFRGINQGALKTVWGDGVVDAEAKFQDLEHRAAKGLQIVCSNFAPILKSETNIKIEGHESVGALARRILPCMLKPTSMAEKGRQLKMTRSQMATFVKEHALEFAVYFTRTYYQDPRKFATYSYDQDYLSDMEQDQEIQMKIQEDINVLFEEKSSVSFTEGLKVLNEQIDVNRLLLDIIKEDDNIRYEEATDGDMLYINSSSSYLSRFGSEKLRGLLKRAYKIEKKYGMRMFAIKLTEADKKVLTYYRQEWQKEFETFESTVSEPETPSQYESSLNYDQNRYVWDLYSKEYYDKHLKKDFQDIIDSVD